jgi:hypothetical protein
MNDSEKTIEQRVKDWLLGEGYPLEFRTARAFRRQGFWARQGEYVRGPKESLREVDVIAHRTIPERIRICHVIECKWSGDKPWVVFTSEGQQMASSACVNQAISSCLARSMVWILAGDQEVADLRLFASPLRPGFSGRQAFAKGNDLFYTAVQSVVSKAKAIVDEYDDDVDLVQRIPEWGAVAFPVVILQGGLFEGYMNWATGEIAVEASNHIRVHWRGSEAWAHHATVDIVSEAYVEEFARIRAQETDLLLEKMRLARANIESCWAKSSLSGLDFRQAPRGTRGLPALLRLIQKREQERQIGPTDSETDTERGRDDADSAPD